MLLISGLIREFLFHCIEFEPIMRLLVLSSYIYMYLQKAIIGFYKTKKIIGGTGLMIKSILKMGHFLLYLMDLALREILFGKMAELAFLDILFGKHGYAIYIITWRGIFFLQYTFWCQIHSFSIVQISAVRNSHMKRMISSLSLEQTNENLFLVFAS